MPPSQEPSLSSLLELTNYFIDDLRGPYIVRGARVVRGHPISIVSMPSQLNNQKLRLTKAASGTAGYSC